MQRVHNLTLEGIHAYYTQAANEHLLVHNCRVGDLGGKAADFDAYELAQLARGRGDIDDLTRPSFDRVRAALDTDGVRIRDGLDGRDPMVRFQHDGVTMYINEARPWRSMAFIPD